MNEVLKKNLEYSERYYQKIENVEIPKWILPLLKKKKIQKIADLGCGDGGIISSIIQKYPHKKIIGIDISPRRIRDLKRKYRKNSDYKFFCRDVIKTKLPSKYFDLIICTQVIEHLENDRKLIREVYRLLKPSGYFYISSVIKKHWAIYKYRNNGKFVLDPTHVREYRSKEEFIKLFKNKFKLLRLSIFPVKRKKIISFIIPGYYIIESLWKKLN